MNGSEASPKPEKNERLSYLLDVYKLYHGHINTMFNYFLVLSGFVLSAFVQSVQVSNQIPRFVSFGIALFGATLSIISLLIHMRSRDMMDTIEAALKIEEGLLFAADQPAFLKSIPKRSWFGRHRNQFPLTYYFFTLGFLALAAFACWPLIVDMGQRAAACLRG